MRSPIIALLALCVAACDRAPEISIPAPAFQPTTEYVDVANRDAKTIRLVFNGPVHGPTEVPRGQTLRLRQDDAGFHTTLRSTPQ